VEMLWLSTITYNYKILSAKRINYVCISGKANYQPDTESISEQSV
jgi:hypothetical protein